ncbi:MAG: hypothetical protein Ta2A_26370 [Treponemataceae bacterium]|nr:MAG: hypothetical protein Ta2A_26370 [Treponemataceae bacterium]
MNTATAKVFTSGNSQAVRLPKEFTLVTDEVYIRRDAESIILTPKANATWHDFFNTPPCPDFVLERDVSLPEEKDLF